MVSKTNDWCSIRQSPAIFAEVVLSKVKTKLSSYKFQVTRPGFRNSLWASCQYWNRHRSAKPQMWVRFPPRSPMTCSFIQLARWGGSSMGLERRIPKPKGGSSSLPRPTKRFQWEFVKQTTIALSMALWSKRSLASLSRRRRRSVTGQSCHFNGPIV